jgi:hypothetical protein
LCALLRCRTWPAGRTCVGFPAVLVRLDRITVADLQELIVEAWHNRAPKRLAKQYLAER